MALAICQVEAGAMDPLHNDRTLRLLHSALDAASQRHRALSANIANLDTPGYKTRDLDFHAAMASELERLEMGSPNELSGEEGTSHALEEVPSLTQRPDGNNVDLDREMANMAANSTEYRLVNHLLHLRLRLINEQLRANL
jgi:flagellar basal-body rod protein FlgB